MPKVRLCVPSLQLQMENELRGRYGGMMQAKDVGAELGFKHHISWEKWLADVPYIIVNERKRWPVKNVAEKMYLHYHEVSK